MNLVSISSAIARTLLFVFCLWVLNIPTAFVIQLFRADLEALGDDHPLPTWAAAPVVLLLVLLPSPIAWRWAGLRKQATAKTDENGREHDLSRRS
ncbi:MAG: hypothetical protein HEQ23_00720 [Tepidisphaera sp.]